MSRRDPRPTQRTRRPLHACPDCGVEHHCSTDRCIPCRDEDAAAYVGGWYPHGGVLRPIYPERRSA